MLRSVSTAATTTSAGPLGAVESPPQPLKSAATARARNAVPRRIDFGCIDSSTVGPTKVGWIRQSGAYTLYSAPDSALFFLALPTLVSRRGHSAGEGAQWMHHPGLRGDSRDQTSRRRGGYRTGWWDSIHRPLARTTDVSIRLGGIDQYVLSRGPGCSFAISASCSI